MLGQDTFEQAAQIGARRLVAPVLQGILEPTRPISPGFAPNPNRFAAMQASSDMNIPDWAG